MLREPNRSTTNLLANLRRLCEKGSSGFIPAGARIKAIQQWDQSRQFSCFEKIAAIVGSVKEDPHVEFKILVQEAE